MTKDQRQKIYLNAFIRYGRDHQTAVAIEELAECQKELCKMLRCSGDKNHLAEEVADSLITLEQMIQFYGLHDLVEKFMDEKLMRLDTILRKEAYDQPHS